MTYIYAYKKVEEINEQTADTTWYSSNITWNIAETTCNMNERDFLHYVFNTPGIYGRIDTIRILEIIK